MHDQETGRAETLDTLLQGPDSDIWTTSLTNEWGRCTNGMSKTRTPDRVIIGQQTMVFIYIERFAASHSFNNPSLQATISPICQA